MVHRTTRTLDSDLEKLERENEQLRLFRDAFGRTLPYGYLVVDALGRIEQFGGRAEDILGISRAEALGRDCALVFRPIGWEGNPLVEDSLAPDAPVELYVARLGGPEVPVSLQMYRSLAADGTTEKRLALFRDVSEERSLEEAERHKDRMAVLGELSAGVAHEIRNPLTGIANCAQVLQESFESDDDRQRFVSIVLDEVARLNRIVEGLLNYARPSRPELRESNVREWLERAIDLMRTSLDESEIAVRVQVRGRIPRIYIDPAQIEQVLLNLIRNAQEAMPGGGELTLECSVIRRMPHRRRGTGRRATDRARVTGEGPRQRFVQVRVTDTGAGIPEHLRTRIFNPFFTTRSRGTGLGLSLCQSIVREHGGFLGVRSVEKKGTTFILDLPVERRQGDRRERDS